MASSAYPNQHQYEFLKKLRDHAHGLPVAVWPNPATLKRWMRRRGFRRAFRRLMVTFRNEADYVAAGAATRAAHGLYRLLADVDSNPDAADTLLKHDRLIQQFLRILRMDQQRQRDRRTGDLARTRTPLYLEWLDRRSKARDRAEQDAKYRARVAELLLADLKKYRELVDVPYRMDPRIGPDIAAQILQGREDQRRELEARLRRAGLLPPGGDPAASGRANKEGR